MLVKDVFDQPSPFCKLPLSILENICLEVAVINPLGPPVDLIPLLQTCKSIYRSLAWQFDRHLYARIFRAKFDTRAAIRRMGARAGYTSHLAKQLPIYSQCLKRIRKGDIHASTVHKDLWTCFLMMVESDGKNEAQLVEWAGLTTFIDRVVRERLWEGRDDHHGWPAESSFNALALWLMWFTTDDGAFSRRPVEYHALNTFISALSYLVRVMRHYRCGFISSCLIPLWSKTCRNPSK